MTRSGLNLNTWCALQARTRHRDPVRHRPTSLDAPFRIAYHFSSREVGVLAVTVKGWDRTGLGRIFEGTDPRTGGTGSASFEPASSAWSELMRRPLAFDGEFVGVDGLEGAGDAPKVRACCRERPDFRRRDHGQRRTPEGGGRPVGRAVRTLLFP